MDRAGLRQPPGGGGPGGLLHRGGRWPVQLHDGAGHALRDGQEDLSIDRGERGLQPVQASRQRTPAGAAGQPGEPAAAGL